MKAYNEKPNIVVSYLLGKGLVSFNDESSHKLLGKQILSDLSKEELSKSLQEQTEIKTIFLKLEKEKKAKSKAKPKTKKKDYINEKEK